MLLYCNKRLDKLKKKNRWLCDYCVSSLSVFKGFCGLIQLGFKEKPKNELTTLIAGVKSILSFPVLGSANGIGGES